MRMTLLTLATSALARNVEEFRYTDYCPIEASVRAFPVCLATLCLVRNARVRTWFHRQRLDTRCIVQPQQSSSLASLSQLCTFKCP